jgi:hypothetical protein
MGSAFYAEPLYGCDSREVVTFLTFASDTNADLLVHLAHPECLIEHPHYVSECGRFQAREGEQGWLSNY